MIQQLADAPQESDQMRPRPDGAGVGIAIGLEELREPDGGVDGQDASLEGFDGYSPADGQEQTPEALDSHDDRPGVMQDDPARAGRNYLTENANK